MRIKSIQSTDAAFESRYIPDYEELRETVKDLKKAGYRIVLTQGVYDLPHKGHYLYLEKAKSLGDILIVGIDSDELTRQRKGPDRPIVPEDERLEMLVHIRHVDIVTLRHVNHDIGHLIRTVKPNVVVFSETTQDITDKMREEYKDVCDEVVTLPAQATTSTSARIRQLYIEAGNKLSAKMNEAIESFRRDLIES